MHRRLSAYDVSSTHHQSNLQGQCNPDPFLETRSWAWKRDIARCVPCSASLFICLGSEIETLATILSDLCHCAVVSAQFSKKYMIYV